MKKTFYIFFLIIAWPLSAQESLGSLLQSFNSQNIPYITVDELYHLQQSQSVFILDAREREEFEVSHIASAQFIGYSHFSIPSDLKKSRDKNIPIVVYCSLGLRSEKIAEKLVKKGYSDVKNLYGGIFTWKNNGFAVVDSLGNTTEKVHAYSLLWGMWLTKGEKVY